MTQHRATPSCSLARRLLCALVAAGVVGSATALAHPVAQDPTPPATAPTGRVFLPVLHRTWSAGSGPGYDVDRYAIDLAFDIRPGARPGAAGTYRYTAAATILAHTTADDVDEIAIAFTLLNREPIVVRLDGRPVRWTRSADNTAIAVRFPSTMPRSAPFALEIRYNHAPGFNTQRGDPNNTEIAQLWAVNGAGHVFPAGIDPLDRAHFTFTVSAPQPYVVVANGRPTGEVTADGHKTVTWVTDRPITPSDAAVFIGRYTVTDVAGAGGVPITLYRIRPAAETQPTFDALVRQHGWFASRLGVAHEQMRYVEGGAQVSVGVPGLYIVGTIDIQPNALALERNAAMQARQWFNVTNSFEASEDASWLHTGLSTYLGLLYLARDQGPEIVRARLNAIERSYAANVHSDLPLAQVTGTDRTDNEWSLALSKPPFAAHRVRLALGDAAFWAALRRYRALVTDGAPSLAAFEAAVFEATGPTPALRSLLDEVFRRAAVPRLHLAWSTAGGRARVRACQLTATPIAFALPLAMHGRAGVAMTAIALDAADQVVDLPYAGAVDAVTPDPEQLLLADVIVHPRFDTPLPACADLPPPALAAPSQPAVAGAAAPARLDEAMRRGAAGEGAVAPAARHDHAVARAAVLRPRPATGAAAPGEPSIGDPYIPRLGNTGYDVLTYTVKARIDPLAKHVAADTRVQARSVVTELTRLSLDFHRVVGEAGLALSAVEVDGTAAPYAQPADSEKLWIDLPRPMAEGEAFEMRFVYAGTPRRVGGGLMPHAQDTMYAISCPTGTGNWIPVNDHPRDKAVWRFELTVPTPFRVTANGVRVSEEVGPDETTAVFEMRQPMATYLATAAVGRFRTADQSGPPGVAIRHHFLNDPAIGLGAVGVTPQILDAFSRSIAPYPFESYGHFAAPDEGSAMETQTMTAIGGYLLESAGPRDVHRLVAHEAAHQWFGNAVSPYSWADIWLNEGFATYFEVAWSVDGAGPEPFGWLMDGVRYSALSRGEPAPLSQPQYMFGTNTYDKGAWVLQMLRGRLGDTAFWQGLRAYYAAHRYGTASTDDFEAAMAAAAAGTGVDVAALFDQWVHRAGNPQVYVGWSQPQGGDVSVRLCQVGEPFELPITLAAHGAGRAVRTSALLADAPVEVRLPAPFPVDGVTPDPDVQLLADLRVVRLEGLGAATTCDAVVAAWSTGNPVTASP